MMRYAKLTSGDVTSTAQAFGVQPELALAIWNQESDSGRNTKTSPKGAVGGFQVTQPTFNKYVPGGDINDPADNMLAGILYMKDLSKRYGGDPEKIAQGYYHGVALKPGEEGPNSGAGTPTTRQYGQKILAKMGVQQPTGKAMQPMPEGSMAGVKPADQALTEDLFGTPEEEDTTDQESEDGEEVQTAEEEGIPEIAGLTGPLVPNTGTFASPGDMELNQAGSQNYELDQYIRSLVDEELA